MSIKETKDKKMTFSTNIIVTFTTIILVALLLITFFNYYQSSKTVMSLNSDLINKNTEQIILETNHFLNDAEVSTKILSKSINKRDYFANEEQSFKEMWKFLIPHKQLAFIYIADKEGTFVQVRRSPKYATRTIRNLESKREQRIIYRDSLYNMLDTAITENSYDHRVRPWYKNTSSIPKAHWSDMYIFTSTGKPGITISYPLLDNVSNEQFGVIATDITLESLADFLQKKNTKKNSVSFIVNEKNQLIAFPDSKLAITKENDKIRAILVSELGDNNEPNDKYSKELLSAIKKVYAKHLKSGDSRTLVKEKGTKYIGVIKQFPENSGKNWKIVTIIPEKEVLGSVKSLRLKSIAISIVVIIISILSSLRFANSISKPIIQVSDMVKNLQAGKLDERLNLTRTDEIGEMANIIDGFATNLQDEIITSFEKLAEGDFTFEAKGLIAIPLAKANNSLISLISNIQTTSKQITATSIDVANSSVVLSEGAMNQASSLEEISASLNETALQTKVNAENAMEANKLASHAQEVAASGSKQMNSMITAMDEISSASKNIDTIIKSIDDIAFQTNLLALNAAVEAARAGVHGKGFAVVADEVRNLAGRSSKAASETAKLIESSVEKTAEGIRIADETSQFLKQIVEKIEDVSKIVSEIANASSEQANGIAEINIGVTQIDSITQQNSAGAERSADVASELSNGAKELQEMLNQFSI